MISAPKGFQGVFHTGLPARSAYSEGAGPYRIVPAAVAVPEDLDDLVRLVLRANDAGWHLIPRGAGSGMPGGNVGPGIVVDLSRFDRTPTLLGCDSAVAGAAVTRKALDDAASSRKLRFPPDPSSGAYCTLGGMIATNAAGARSVLVGSVRPWIQALDIVTGDGEFLSLARGERSRSTGLGSRFASTVEPYILQAVETIHQRYPRVRKNSAGYALDAFIASGDLLDLVIGSEGTLAFVTSATVRVEPRPRCVAGLLIGLRALEAVGAVAVDLLALRPAAVELLDRSFLDMAQASVPFPIDDLAAVLLVDFEGPDADTTRAAVLAAAQTVSQDVAFAHDALTGDEHARMWALRHAASPVLAALPEQRRSLQIIEDGCVPVENLGTYLSEVRQAAQEVGIDIVAFGHAGDGHLHVNALVDTTDPDFHSRIITLYQRVTESVIRLGGTPSGEHGDGRLRAGALYSVYGPEILGLFRVVKDVFDPGGIMNPGVVLADEEASPLGALKVGSQAEPVLPYIAAGLRRMERTGGWGTPKLELLLRDHPR